MNAKQKKNLIRIIITAVLMLVLAYMPLSLADGDCDTRCHGFGGL